MQCGGVWELLAYLWRHLCNHCRWQLRWWCSCHWSKGEKTVNKCRICECLWSTRCHTYFCCKDLANTATVPHNTNNRRQTANVGARNILPVSRRWHKVQSTNTSTFAHNSAWWWVGWTYVVCVGCRSTSGLSGLDELPTEENSKELSNRQWVHFGLYCAWRKQSQQRNHKSTCTFTFSLCVDRSAKKGFCWVCERDDNLV